MFSSNSYPFDSFLDVFNVSALRWLDFGTGRVVEPIGIRFSGMFDSYDANINTDQFGSIAQFKVRIQRSGTAKFFSVSVIILMWLLSFTILTLAVTIWVRKRTVEAPVSYTLIIIRLLLLLPVCYLLLLN